MQPWLFNTHLPSSPPKMTCIVSAVALYSTHSPLSLNSIIWSEHSKPDEVNTHTMQNTVASCSGALVVTLAMLLCPRNCRFIIIIIMVLQHRLVSGTGQCHFPSFFVAGVTNLNEPPSSFFAPSPLLRVRSWLRPLQGHCEQQAMRDEGVIYVAGHPWLNGRCTRLPECIRLRNDLYCVGWGVKLY